MLKTTQLFLLLILLSHGSQFYAQTQKELDSLKKVAEMEEVFQSAIREREYAATGCLEENKRIAKEWRKDKKRVGDSLMIGKDGTLFLCGSPSVRLSRSIIESGLMEYKDFINLKEIIDRPTFKVLSKYKNFYYEYFPPRNCNYGSQTILFEHSKENIEYFKKRVDSINRSIKKR